MYMNTRANLDYWSTDNCCLRWSLRTGSIIIGLLSLVWQSLMVTSGVMMLVECPIRHNNTTTATTTTTNLTVGNEALIYNEGGGVGEMVVSSNRTDNKDITAEDIEEVVRCPFRDGDVGLSEVNSSVGGGDNTSIDTSSGTGESPGSNSSPDVLIECPWLPDPETKVLGVYNKEKLFLVAGIFIAYSGIYCILSVCVVVGSITSSVSLIQGWVAFTSFHNIIILASLLVPLPFTTLLHLFLSITYFILSLYTWAVVKSYMHVLKVELNKPLLPEGSITDYTVDGVDVSEIPVQV